MLDTPLDPRFANAQTIFFVVGAQKSGTTWLHRYLSSHPEVCVPLLKETNYWRAVELGPDFGKKTLRKAYKRAVKPSFSRRIKRLLSPGKRIPRAYRRGVAMAMRANSNPGAPHAFYGDVMFQAQTRRSRAFGEVCPQYAILEPDTISQMATLSENVRFIFLMRDPLGRAMSAIKHGMRSSHGRKAKFDTQMVSDAAEQALAKRRGWGFDKSWYHETLEKLEGASDAEKIHTMFFETMFTQDEISRLNAFLGVSDHPAEFDVKANVDNQPGIGISPELEQRLVVSLGPVYEALDRRFGARLPAEWKSSMSRLGNEVSAYG